jgi:hypothetical protein
VFAFPAASTVVQSTPLREYCTSYLVRSDPLENALAHETVSELFSLAVCLKLETGPGVVAAFAGEDALEKALVPIVLIEAIRNW